MSIAVIATSKNYISKDGHLNNTREGFLKNNIVAVSFVFKIFLYTSMLNTYLFPSIEIIQAYTSFSIYIYASPVNIHCHFKCTD